MAAAITVGDILTKLRTDEDSSGDVWFAIMVEVTNNTEDPLQVRLDLQAVDDEGFELKDLTLRGLVGPGEAKRFSDRDYMPYQDYQQIAEWQIKNYRIDDPD
jgi:hypothetical protein